MALCLERLRRRQCCKERRAHAGDDNTPGTAAQFLTDRLERLASVAGVKREQAAQRFRLAENVVKHRRACHADLRASHSLIGNFSVGVKGKEMRRPKPAEAYAA